MEWCRTVVLRSSWELGILCLGPRVRRRHVHSGDLATGERPSRKLFQITLLSQSHVRWPQTEFENGRKRRSVTLPRSQTRWNEKPFLALRVKRPGLYEEETEGSSGGVQRSFSLPAGPHPTSSSRNDTRACCGGDWAARTSPCGAPCVCRSCGQAVSSCLLHANMTAQEWQRASSENAEVTQRRLSATCICIRTWGRRAAGLPGAGPRLGRSHGHPPRSSARAWTFLPGHRRGLLWWPELEVLSPNASVMQMSLLLMGVPGRSSLRGRHPEVPWTGRLGQVYPRTLAEAGVQGQGVGEAASLLRLLCLACGWRSSPVAS